MKTQIEELESLRKNFYHKYQRRLILGVITFILIIGIFLLVINEVKKNQFLAEYKKNVIKAITKDTFYDATYYPNAMIDIHEIKSAELVKNPDRSMGEDLIRGTYDNIKFEASDITLQERHVLSNQRNKLNFTTFFKGRWYIFEVEKSIQGTIKIQEGRFGAMTTKNLSEVIVNNADFNHKFKLFASSKEIVDQVLTSEIIKKIMKLEQLHQGSLHFSFINTKLHIGINDNIDYFHLDIKKSLNDENLKIYYEQVEIIKKIIAELNLSIYK